jgi:hypothetical protein
MTAHDLPGVHRRHRRRRAGQAPRRNRQCTLAIDGRPILDRQRDLLRDLTTLLMMTREDRQPPATDISVVRDRIPGARALGGPYTVLVEARTDTVLVLACDMRHRGAPPAPGRGRHRERRCRSPRWAGSPSTLCVVRPSRGTASARLHTGWPADYPRCPATSSVREIGPDELSALESAWPPAPPQRGYAGRLRARRSGPRGNRPS